MTLVAATAALASHYPRLGISVAFVLAMTAAIYLADRFVAVANTRWWALLTAAVWVVVAIALLAIAVTCFAALGGTPGGILAACFALGAWYAYFMARKSIQRGRTK